MRAWFFGLLVSRIRTKPCGICAALSESSDKCRWHFIVAAYVRIFAFVCDSFRRQNG